MLYDANRTRDVVNRLVLLGNRLQAAMIVIHATLFGGLLGILGQLAAQGIGLIIFGLAGIVIGVFIGMYIAAALAVVLEWMAQMLISHQPKV